MEVIETAWRNDCGEIRSTTSVGVSRALAEKFNGTALVRTVTYGEWTEPDDALPGSK